jgi:hypothetical protein
MKKTSFLLLFLFLFVSSFSQTKKLHFQLRLPLQFDFQKAEIIYPLRTELQSATTFNFGFDALINYQHNKFSIYTGIGFFRNKFSIKREYNHQALNVGVDSLPIGTDAENYTYSQLRLPIGASFTFLETKKMNYKIGVDYLNRVCSTTQPVKISAKNAV